jgi:hypothetical protein
MRKRVFIHSEDAELALKLIRLLDGNGVTAFCVSEDEAVKLKELWREEEEQYADVWLTS